MAKLTNYSSPVRRYNKHLNESETCEFKNAVNTVCRKYNLRMQDLANLIGLSRQMLSAMMNDKYPVTRTTCLALLEVYSHMDVYLCVEE